MPKFGPRKIGRAQFELLKVRQAQKKKFGPRKFGAKKAAIMAQQLAEAEQAVAQEQPSAQVQEQRTSSPAPEGATTSVKQMAKALGENVALLDEFIELEQQRPNGARKTALKLFLGTELAKEDKARDEVIEQLQQLLKG